jgi:hypothetical protein
MKRALALATVALSASLVSPAHARGPISILPPLPQPAPPALVIILQPGACLRGPLQVRTLDGTQMATLPAGTDYPRGCSAPPSVGGLRSLNQLP